MAPRSPEQFAEIREVRRHQILDAALHVFAEDSYHGSSIAAVAKRAKVSKGLIYNYFKSKEELLLTLITDLFDEAMELMDVDPEVPLTHEKFIDVIHKSVDVSVQNPQRWKLYMSLSFQPDVTPLLMEKMLPRIQPFMIQMNNYFMERGHQDPITMMRYYSAVMDGVQLHILMDPQNFPVDKVKQMMIDQFA
ncbi:MAG: TetR/AcrR family transcriptional regulator [Flavobacteriales bacterium]|nr:TetR/AcrR family transcriptional regulator [Flavobacteriales bacterium]MCB9203567.1 TetR/AcrR family transcriptional regulator [Flavobacteriales bacterium]